MTLYTSASQLIGNTPLLRLQNVEKKYDCKGALFAKLEYFNVTGSVKDRIALAMIEEAEKTGVLKKESVIVEPTSGNTGIGLASVAAAKGYRCIIVMPETMSKERRAIIRYYGAEIVLSEGAKGMKGAIEKAQEIAAQHSSSFIPSQFTNPSNPQIHYQTTGPELQRDLNGKIDFFIAGVGTGGTISGTGKFLKEHGQTEVIAVEPDASPVLSGGQAGAHKIQGIGAGFIPDTLDTTIYDAIVRVSNEDAFQTAKELAVTEGIGVGISSGAALYTAIKEAQKEENKGKNIVVLLPDSADRYYSTSLFEE